MAKKTTKKVNPKETVKTEVFTAITHFLEECGYKIDTDYESYGFTKNTIVIKTDESDIRIQISAPKAGLTEYPKIEEEEKETEE